MATNQPGASAPQPYGEVFDRGYQHYDGPRLGRSSSVKALTLYSVKRGVGIKKRWTAKIMPIILYGLAYLPAIVITAIIAFIPAEGLGYGSLYGFLEFIILIFAASVAPEMLCDDRRENVLPLYFSRPITRLDYLVAKISAMAILMSTIVFGPALMLFAGRALTADSPASWVVRNFDEVLRIFAFGVLISALYAAIGLVIATFTTRKGIAAASMIVGLIIFTGIVNALNQATDTFMSRFLVFLSPFQIISGTRAWVFGEPVPNDSMLVEADMPGFTYGLAILLYVCIAAFIMHRRYLRED